VAVAHDGAAYTMAIYFTSEAAARQGERKEPPAELKAQMDEMDALSIGVPEFFRPEATIAVSPRRADRLSAWCRGLIRTKHQTKNLVLWPPTSSSLVLPTRKDDHPDDHPDDRTGPVWIRRDRTAHPT
jgi:hypothetical protein